MKLRPRLPAILLAAIAAAASTSRAQTPAPQTSSTAAAATPAFEVATIKPSGPKGSPVMGFYSRPGGRVFFGNSSVKTILFYAFQIQEYQIAGGPDWIGKDKYDIEAIPSDTAASRTAKQPNFAATPTDEQRHMLQSLLADRFKLQCHMETREAPVYILSRGSGKLELHEPADKDADMRGGVTIKGGGIVDGEAHGVNLSMAFLASQLSRLLRQPVIDQTGLTGRYDYGLPPEDSENHDLEAAVSDAMHRLGLDLKRGKGPVETLVIDHIEKPSEN